MHTMYSLTLRTQLQVKNYENINYFFIKCTSEFLEINTEMAISFNLSIIE